MYTALVIVLAKKSVFGVAESLELGKEQDRSTRSMGYKGLRNFFDINVR